MASIKFKNARGVERGCEDGFGGIDGRSRRPSDSLAFVSNLDTNSDGSLSTRSGYREIMSMSAPIRAVLSAGKTFYCLAGDELTETDTESGETNILGKVRTSSGDGELFFLGGNLYAHDSQKLYCLEDGELRETDGYAPLYGKEWHPEKRGPIFENLNLASDRIRISYLTADSCTVFDLGLEAESLDRVEINGEVKDLDTSGIVLDGSRVDFTKNVGLADGMIITFWLTLKGSASKRSELAGSMRSFVFSNSGGERLCLYLPEGSPMLLCSRIPVASELEESRKTASDSSSLYLPHGSALRIGNSSSPITGMAHHKDRALLFTDSDTWCVDFEGKEKDPDYLTPKLFLLNSAIGAEAGTSFAHCENDPISYYRGKLFQWHSASGVRDECSAELISEAVSDLIPKDAENVAMLALPHMGMIFISDGDSIDGKVIVYNTEMKTFTLYSGIFAEKLFTFGSNPAFSRGERIYLLCGNTEKDIDDGEEHSIVCRIVSHFLDFGCPEKDKHSLSLLMCGSFAGTVRIRFENENGEQVSFTFEKTEGVIEERFRLPRFKKLRYTIESLSPIRLDNIILSAK
ncbi:MAG: hypothetical protein J6S71_01550 [Clostridia bacterium]|nr:hypothetical protein [Clostridia bacterium]